MTSPKKISKILKEDFLKEKREEHRHDRIYHEVDELASPPHRKKFDGKYYHLMGVEHGLDYATKFAKALREGRLMEYDYQKYYVRVIPKHSRFEDIRYYFIYGSKRPVPKVAKKHSPTRRNVPFRVRQRKASKLKAFFGLPDPYRRR